MADRTQPIREAAGAGPQSDRVEPRPRADLQTRARVPADPDSARAEIEMTRTRMSETIDEIEDVLIRRKARIQNRLDFLAPVRERPFPSAGIALGAGLALGLLTGRNDADTEVDDLRQGEEEYWKRRADSWENRARRLRNVARAQREDIRDLQERWGEDRARSLEQEIAHESHSARWTPRHAGGAMAGFLSRSARDMFRGSARRRFR